MIVSRSQGEVPALLLRPPMLPNTSRHDNTQTSPVGEGGSKMVVLYAVYMAVLLYAPAR